MRAVIFAAGFFAGALAALAFIVVLLSDREPIILPDEDWRHA